MNNDDKVLERLDRIVEILKAIAASECKCSFWTGSSKCEIPSHHRDEAGGG